MQKCQILSCPDKKVCSLIPVTKCQAKQCPPTTEHLTHPHQSFHPSQSLSQTGREKQHPLLRQGFIPGHGLDYKPTHGLHKPSLGLNIKSNHGPILKMANGPNVKPNHGPNFKPGHGLNIKAKHGPIIKPVHGPNIKPLNGHNFKPVHGLSIKSDHRPNFKPGHGLDKKPAHGLRLIHEKMKGGGPQGCHLVTERRCHKRLKPECGLCIDKCHNVHVCPTCKPMLDIESYG